MTVHTTTVTIASSQGLHARPAAELVEAMKGFDSSVRILVGEKKADTKSIMSVLALGAASGSEATIEAEGPQAEEAIAAAAAILTTEED